MSRLINFPSAPPPPLEVTFESLAGAPFAVTLDQPLLEQRLQEDLAFTPATLGLLGVTISGKGNILAMGRYVATRGQVILFPRGVFRQHPRAATHTMTRTLMHEAFHAAEDIIQGRSRFADKAPRRTADFGVCVAAMAGVSALTGHQLSDLAVPGWMGVLDVSCGMVAAIATDMAYYHFFAGEEKRARAFEADPDMQKRWQGVLTIESA